MDLISIIKKSISLFVLSNDAHLEIILGKYHNKMGNYYISTEKYNRLKQYVIKNINNIKTTESLITYSFMDKKLITDEKNTFKRYIVSNNIHAEIHEEYNMLLCINVDKNINADEFPIICNYYDVTNEKIEEYSFDENIVIMFTSSNDYHIIKIKFKNIKNIKLDTLNLKKLEEKFFTD